MLLIDCNKRDLFNMAGSECGFAGPANVSCSFSIDWGNVVVVDLNENASNFIITQPIFISYDLLSNERHNQIVFDSFAWKSLQLPPINRYRVWYMASKCHQLGK